MTDRARPPPSDGPVAPAEFAEKVTSAGPFPVSASLAVAVSGGADSMAMLLLRDWAGATARSLTALTVDHGLRPDSSDEARQVGQWCASLRCLMKFCAGEPKAGAPPGRSAARPLRIDGIWCAEHEIENLFVAHTENDQAETFLFRMSRGSGRRVGGDAFGARPGPGSDHPATSDDQPATPRNDVESGGTGMGEAPAIPTAVMPRSGFVVWLSWPLAAFRRLWLRVPRASSAACAPPVKIRLRGWRQRL